MKLARALLILALVSGCGQPTPPGPFLLITVDTLRADRLGAYGSDRDLTPQLDALASDALVFDAAYAPAPFTVPSIAALMTGRYPRQLGIWKNESGLPEGVPTLATELRARGWRTAAVVSNFVLREAAGLAAGFELYDDTFPDTEAVRRWPERTARATTDAALAALAGCTVAHPRCLLWVHYQDPHGPYTPPAERRQHALERERREPDGRRMLPIADERGVGGIPRYQALGEQREVAWYRAGYDGEVAHTDAEIGRLLRGLDETGLAENALVVFAADHGESLGEGDYWFAHGGRLSEVLVRVPLLLRGPGIEPGRRDDVVSLVDVVPTLLRLLTGDPAPAGAEGRDLLARNAPTEASRPYLSTLGAAKVTRYGLVDREHKLVVVEDGSGEDVQLRPRGRDDASVDDPEAVAALRAEVDALRRRIPAAPEVRLRLTPEDRRKLRALGYLD